MFERVDVSGEALGRCADGLHASVGELRLVAARRLARVVHWADLHAPAPGRVGVVVGGDGTPEVTPFAATELGCLLQTTTASARSLLADGLDLRHRLPRCWEAVMTGRVEDFKARHVARATRAAGLTADQARQVDAGCVAALTGLPWGRAMTVVEAAIIAADPAGHERRRAEAAHERYVATSRRDTTTGLRTLITRTTAGDVARIEAMVAHLAELLRLRGDTDPLQVRRAKAIAVLADPAAACVLLARAHDEVTPAARDARAPRRQPPVAPGAAPSSLHPAPRRPGPSTPPGCSSAPPRSCPRSPLRGGRVGGAPRAEEAWASRRRAGPQPRPRTTRRGRGVPVTRAPRWPTPQGPTYETPRAMREALTLTRPFEVFPWGTLPARSADLDHTIPYRPPDEGGPPGQTWPGNLGPLARGHHNAKTHGGFTLEQPTPGTYVWVTPTGYRYQVDHTGTHALGRQDPTALTASQEPSVMETHFARLLTAA